jgi:hypothetical protein
MTDRATMNEQHAALEGSLERSLRGGPPDEGGYRAEAVDFSADAHVETRRGLRRGPSSVGAGRRAPGTIPVFASLDAVVMLVVVVFVGVVLVQRTIPGGSGGFPSPTETATASPIPVPPLTETFVSTRNGFSVRYPDGWSTTAATTSWRPSTLLPFGSPALDELRLDGSARLVVASQRLQAGQTEASWIASYGQDYFLQRCSGDRATWPRVSVDGATGYLDLNGCPVPADHDLSTPDVAFSALVFVGDRVYRIGLDGVVDLPYFEAILATMRLDPASAIDPAPTP